MFIISTFTFSLKLCNFLLCSNKKYRELYSNESIVFPLFVFFIFIISSSTCIPCTNANIYLHFALHALSLWDGSSHQSIWFTVIAANLDIALYSQLSIGWYINKFKLTSMRRVIKAQQMKSQKIMPYMFLCYLLSSNRISRGIFVSLWVCVYEYHNNSCLFSTTLPATLSLNGFIFSSLAFVDANLLTSFLLAFSWDWQPPQSSLDSPGSSVCSTNLISMHSPSLCSFSGPFSLCFWTI